MQTSLKAIKEATAESPTNSGRASTSIPDAELVALCQESDKLAFDLLIRRYRNMVNAELFRLAPDWHDRDDLAQEVYIRVWRWLPQLRRPQAFRRWLHTIITNVFKDEARRRLRAKVISLDEPVCEDGTVMEIADCKNPPDEVRWRQEVLSSVQDAMSHLPRNFRKALELRECDGLSYDEISQKLGCPIGTVKSRVKRARDKVRYLLDDRLAA